MESGVTSLSGASPMAANVVTVGRGVVRRRPGIAAWSGAPSAAIHSGAISMVHESLDGRLWAVGEGTINPFSQRIFKVLPAGAVNLSDHATGDLAGSKRPVIVETELLLVLAAGDSIQRVEFSSEISERLTEEVKPTHVTAMGQRLVANDYLKDTGLIRYSEIAFGDLSWAGHGVWVGSYAGSFEGESNPDAVLAVSTLSGYLVVFGQRTTQIFAQDNEQVFLPISTWNVGMAARYSSLVYNDAIYWLDDKRHFVRATPNSFDILSSRIQKTIDEISVVGDCWAFSVKEDNAEYLVWVFPTDGRAFCYQDGVGWSVWLGWGGTNWKNLNISSHCRRVEGIENLVGTADGKVAWLTNSVHTDLGDPINAYVQTGRMNRGTESIKQCDGVTVALRRGHATQATSTHAVLSYRDHPGRPWRSLPVRLGGSGDLEPVVRFRSLGAYRGREWRFEFSGPDELDLVSVTEEYTVTE
jgi:hypothetical protein